MDIPSKIKTLRQARGYSVSRLAAESGVSIPYLRQIESGKKRNPTADVLQKLAVALSTTVSDLVGAPLSFTDDALQSVPKALKELARKKGKQLDLRPEDVEMLKNIHYRGRQPAGMEDWELIFSFLKRILG